MLIYLLGLVTKLDIMIGIQVRNFYYRSGFILSFSRHEYILSLYLHVIMQGDLLFFFIKAEYEEKEQDIQKKMDEVRDKKTQLEQTQRFKKDQIVSK